MFEIKRQQIDWGGRPLTLETGHMARQATGAVMATYGQTVVLATVVAARNANPDLDFLPLTVHYQEKYYAAGRIPGGYIKREGRPSEKETLTSRLIDRPIRPLFHERFFNEVQVLITVLSHDQENNPDIVGMVAASAALAISGLPFHGPIGAARIGHINGQWVLNPVVSQMPETQLDLIVAGTKDAIMMVESEAHELTEDQMLDAVMYGQQEFQSVIAMIEKLAADVNPTAWEVPEASQAEKDLHDVLKAKAADHFREAYKEPLKQLRYERLAQIRAQLLQEHAAEEGIEPKTLATLIKKIEQEIVRHDILTTGKRIDGRDLVTVRPIHCDVGFLPRTHGSVKFTRGETQALVITTLGTAQDEQVQDDLEGERREKFMLHYNFPSFSVGEVGRVGPIGRRELGHGKLAWRSLNPVMPKPTEFPYTVRVVSEILESNGSSSMATVCGASLAMMDAGVPLKRPVAGIAMGLIKEDADFCVLTDILGDEDHLGDMDFKVAGTADGVTSLQMDIKIAGINKDIMHKALAQAKDARLHILGIMNAAIDTGRTEVSPYAPRMETIQISPEKIGEIIGPGGKIIRDICETTKTKIDIDDEGHIKISGFDEASIKAAITRIQGIVVEPEMDKIYPGKVVKTKEFGAFVSFLGERQGLVHISELAPGRVPNVEAVVKEGDEIFVKVIGVDERGRVKLSMKVVNQQTGMEIEVTETQGNNNVASN